MLCGCCSVCVPLLFMYVCTKRDDSRFGEGAAIDAVAGRGGEAPGRRVARRQAHHERMRDASALGKRPRATRSFRRRTTRSRWRAPSTCWTAWRRWARTLPNYTLLRSKETKAKRREKKRTPHHHKVTRKRKETAQTARHRRGLARAVLINSL